jgi:acyl carrier protein phosphodiesterase
MNFLAHLYLSQNNKNILLGNFIADPIKGNKYKAFPQEIQTGILLHRAIDNFTDTHAIVKKSKRRLHERYKHYDGVIIDIFYDHFLAKNWAFFSEVPLPIYVNAVYDFLEASSEIFPERIKYMFPYMVRNNWLLSYASTQGIEKILSGMNRRTKGISKMNLAINDLHDHYEGFEKDFLTFFSELIAFTKTWESPQS